MLVFACTNDATLNRLIAQDARKIGAWVNAADQPEDCDFFLPATIVRNDVIVAVGTGGASPALAGMLRDRLAQTMPERIGQFAAMLATVRQELKALLEDPRRRMTVMTALCQPDAYEEFLTGGEAAVRARLEKLLQ